MGGRWRWVVGLVGAAMLVACGGDGGASPPAASPSADSGAEAPGEPAAPDGGATPDAPAAAADDVKTAIVELGDETYEFEGISCVMTRDGYVDAASRNSEARLEAVAEEGARTAVTIRAADNRSWQYSMGEGNSPEPEVVIDGDVVVFTGTFADAYGSGETRPGRVELHC